MAKRKHTRGDYQKAKGGEGGDSRGNSVADASRRFGVSSRLSTAGGPSMAGFRIDQARRLKQLETENGRLKRAMAELALDNQFLREAAERTF